MRNVIIGITAVLLIVGGVIALTRKSTDTTPSPTAPTTTNGTDTTTDQTTAGTTITYNGSSFSPATLTVKSGSNVTIKNDSDEPLQVQSDPHPVHTDNPELNVGVVSPGQSKTFTVTAKGTWGYHNHLDSAEAGTIVVN